MKITQPTLIIDREKCLSNIKKMVNKSRKYKVKLRPHFKTHQSAVIGNWFKNHSIASITVSSVSMAKYFADNGWNNITIAFPLNIREIEEINKLAVKINLNVIFESTETVNFLKTHLLHRTGGYIKIDTGSHRTGIIAENIKQVDKVLNQVKNCPKITFKGFITHAGHSYQAKTKEEIALIHRDSLKKLNRLKDRYINVWKNIELSIGDTPCCSLMEDFSGIDEIRPGNFIFYDIMQYHIGACSLDEIAVALACPVVAKHKERNEIIIYGGAVHLSKEYIYNKDNIKIFGYVVEINKGKWNTPIEGAYISSISQEHGIMKIPDKYFEKIRLGDIIGILPVHSCLTNNLMKSRVLIM